MPVGSRSRTVTPVATQRLGQARGQMRRRQAERSFRRAAAGLTELKRARDQLRGPVEVLDVILADATSLAQLTSIKAMEGNSYLTLPDGAADEAEEGADERAGQGTDPSSRTLQPS